MSDEGDSPEARVPASADQAGHDKKKKDKARAARISFVGDRFRTQTVPLR